MIINTPVSGVRAFAPMNYLGAPQIVYSPGEEDGGAPQELSLDEAASRYAATQATAVDDQAEDEEAAELTTDDELEASAEGEDEGEPGEEDQAEDDDETEESGQGRFVADNAKVRLEDGTITSIAELKKGSLLNADYTRKTQEVAEQRRSVETQSSAIKQQETQLSEQRQLLTTLLTSIAPQAPDPSWADPRSPNYNPAEYMAARAAHEQFVGYVQTLEQQDMQSRQQREQEQAAKKREKGNAEWATLVEKLPTLKDPKRFERFVGDIKTFGPSYGYSEQELAEGLGYDHRAALVMHKAIQWDKLQASKPKMQSKVEGRPPIQKGGKRLTPDAQRSRNTTVAMDRLKQSGSERDGVAAYLALQKG